MPSVSEKQKKFMAAAAHNPKFAKKAGIKPKVAKEFNKADSAASRLRKLVPKYGKGGVVSGLSSSVKKLMEQHHAAITMEDPAAATRIGRKLDQIKPGLSKQSLEYLNSGTDSEDFGRKVKLSTFGKGGLARKAFAELKDVDIDTELKQLQDSPRVSGTVDRRGEVRGDAPERRRYQDLLDERARRKMKIPPPDTKFAEGGKVGAITKLTKMMAKYTGDTPKGGGKKPAAVSPVHIDTYGEKYTTPEELKHGIFINWYGESDEPNYHDVSKMLEKLPGTEKARQLVAQADADSRAGKDNPALIPAIDAEFDKLGIKPPAGYED